MNKPYRPRPAEHECIVDDLIGDELLATRRLSATKRPCSSAEPTSLPAFLLDQVDSPLASFTVDGDYDQDGVYGEFVSRHPEASVIVPPRSSAVPSDTAQMAPMMRDRHLRTIAERGRMALQKAAG